MASSRTEKQPGAHEGTAERPAQLAKAPVGHTQSSECPVMRNPGQVSAQEPCGTQGEDMCPIGPVSEPEFQEEGLRPEEERLKPEVEALVERGPRPQAPVVKSGHGLKRKPVNLLGPTHQAHPKAEAELPQGLLLKREDLEGSQSEPSPSAKQHKKAKKRKSLGAPVLPVMASTVSAFSENLGLERKAQRLRPLYQYINYCNPELNQAEEGEREAEAQMEPQSELTLVPEEECVEQLPALLPVAEEAGEEPGGLPSLGVSDLLKTEMDKSTQVDINKMLSVCAAPLVPPLSPQYK